MKKKKRKKINKNASYAIGGLIVFSLIAFIIFVGFIVLAFTGHIPIFSDMLGTAKAKDLGVKFTNTDYQNAIHKIPASLSNVEDMCFGCPLSYKGAVAMNTTLTEREFSALINKMNEKSGPIKDMQIKFNSDGTAELSAMANYSGINAPVYAEFTIDSSSGSPEFNIQSLSFASVAAGQGQIDEMETQLNSGVQDFFSDSPELGITEMSISGGQIDIVGTIPENITAS
ncbi:hypothetical protein KJ780_05400 [Candidatus Micrarchaeota archaeon]|nr:hypothetical protein [Candidatus Micrarchaeota archaeon]